MIRTIFIAWKINQHFVCLFARLSVCRKCEKINVTAGTRGFFAICPLNYSELRQSNMFPFCFNACVHFSHFRFQLIMSNSRIDMFCRTQNVSPLSGSRGFSSVSRARFVLFFGLLFYALFVIISTVKSQGASSVRFCRRSLVRRR